ncbi:MAG: hypothetical protein KKC19_03715 [Nanoarchaeota archaeon]|nr:hypothetical protein [Nanoarchaeota archaeon]
MEDNWDLIISFEEHANPVRKRTRVFGNGLEEIMPDMDSLEFFPLDEESSRLADGIAVLGIGLTSLYFGIASRVNYFQEDIDDAKIYAFGAFALASLTCGLGGLYKHIHRD